MDKEVTTIGEVLARMPIAPEGSQPQPANTPTLIEQANAGNAAAALELLRQRSEAEPPEWPIGFAKVRIHPPKRVVYPDVPRRLDQVDRTLLDLFGQLCAGKKPWPLFVHGPAGAGKSYAALAFADVAGGDYSTLEGACTDVMQDRNIWWERSRCTRMVWGDELPVRPEDRVYRLAIVDEIGERSKVGDLLYTTLKGILDHQEFENRRAGVYLSNLTPSEIASMFDDRIASRLTCGTVFRLAGNDRRHQGGAR